MLPEHHTTVRQIWSDLLNVPAAEIPDDANFFALGGSSYLAARLIARMHASSGVVLSLTAIFEHPTVAELAVISGSSAEALPTVHTRQVPPKLAPISHNQEYRIQRQRWSSQNGLRLGVRNIYASFMVTGLFAAEKFERCVQQVIDTHDELRTVIVQEGDSCYQTVGVAGGFSLERHTPHGGSEQQRELNARREAEDFCREEFVLEAPIRLRAASWAIRPNKSLVVISIDHLVSDAHSARRLLTLISAGYETNTVHHRTGPTHAAHVTQERALLDGGRTREAAVKWREWADLHRIDPTQFPPRLQLNVETPGGPDLASGKCAFTVRKEALGQAHAAARNAGTTFNLVVLAAIGRAIARHSEQDTVVVMSHVDNRDEPLRDEIIGSISNRVPVIIDTRPGEPLAELLPRVRDSFRKALEWKNIPRPALIQYLNPLGNTAVPPWPILSYNSSISLAEDTPFTLAPAAVDPVHLDLKLPIGERGMQIFAQLDDGDLQLKVVYEASRYPASLFAEFERDVVADLTTSDSRQLLAV